MKFVLTLIFCGLLASAMLAKQAGNYINAQLAAVQQTIERAGR